MDGHRSMPMSPMFTKPFPSYRRFAMHARHQIDALNRHPLNQEAKRWLKKADAEMDPSRPYLLQLQLWGLEESDLGLTPDSHRELKARLLPIVTSLLRNPDKVEVQAYLLHGREGHPDDPPHLSLHSLENAQSPEDAATRALDSLNDLVSADPTLDQDFLTD